MNWWKMVRTMNDGMNIPLGSNLWPWLKADIVFFADFRPWVSMKGFVETIRLKEEYQRNVDVKAREMGLDSSIGVHVRYTDKKPKRQLDVLMRKLKTMVDGGMTVFLCTDNADVETDFKRTFNEKVIVTTKYIPKVEGEGIHIWASQQEDDKLKRTMFEDSLMDMWLLSRCKLLYWQGNSSFGMISKLLMNDKTRCVDWLAFK